MENALMCMWDQNCIGVTNLLINKLGLEKDFYTRNICIQDSDGDLRALDYKGKFIRMPVDYYESDYGDSIIFDPINNKNIMKFLFDIFIDEWDDDTYYLSNYYKIFGDSTDQRSQLHVLMSDGSQFTTRKYYNVSLQYMEIIDFMLFGEARFSYQNIDFPPEMESCKRHKRR